MTEVAHGKGLRVGSAGTHPFSLFERQRITAKDRYRALIDQMQYIARRELIFGMHVHVAVDDPEKAIKVVNGLLPQLGPLLALSASSPFWRGEPTGLASSRQMVFSAFPRSGPAATLPRLRGLRRGRRPAREVRLHRRLHEHLVGHPAPSAPRHGGDPDLRRGHARRGRRRHRRVLPVPRQAPLRALRRGRGDPVVPPHPHDREQVAGGEVRAGGARDGSRVGSAQPHSGGAPRSQDARRRSRRTRASSAATESSKASGTSSPAARARTASSASTTRTATSSRSPARSRTRPRRCLLSPRPSACGRRTTWRSWSRAARFPRRTVSASSEAQA